MPRSRSGWRHGQTKRKRRHNAIKHAYYAFGGRAKRAAYAFSRVAWAGQTLTPMVFNNPPGAQGPPKAQKKGSERGGAAVSVGGARTNTHRRPRGGKERKAPQGAQAVGTCRGVKGDPGPDRHQPPRHTPTTLNTTCASGACPTSRPQRELSLHDTTLKQRRKKWRHHAFEYENIA